MTSLLTRCARRSVKWCSLFLVVTLLALPQTAQAQMRISFGATTIFDNLAGDLNPAPDIIDFSGIYAPALYQVSGHLTHVPGPSGVSASTPLSLTLTNFTATAIAGSNLGMPMDISIQSKTILGTYSAGVANSAVSAEVGHFGGLPVPANSDVITGVYSILSDVSNQFPISTLTSGSLPLGNPLFTGGFVPLAYTSVIGHTSGPLPTVTNPVLSGVITFSLGGLDDQLIMPSSYEIGFQAVPEPSTMILLGLAGVGAVIYRKNRRKVS